MIKQVIVVLLVIPIFLFMTNFAYGEEDSGCTIEKPTFANRQSFNTENNYYYVKVAYAPENPTQNCPIHWMIEFSPGSKLKEHHFRENQMIQFDIMLMDENLTLLRSLAQEKGSQFLRGDSNLSCVLTRDLFCARAEFEMIEKEESGLVPYTVWIYGLANEGSVGTFEDYFSIIVPINSKDSVEPQPIIEPKPDPTSPNKIPEWVKNTMGWYAEGLISEDEIIAAIKFLIKEGIIQLD